MTQELKLSGNELILYALIYGFSQDSTSAFYGGINYIAEALNLSTRAVIQLLKKLSDTGLILKEKRVGKQTDIYKYNPKFLRNSAGRSEESSLEKSSREETSPNIKDIIANNNINNKVRCLARRNEQRYSSAV